MEHGRPGARYWSQRSIVLHTSLISHHELFALLRRSFIMTSSPFCSGAELASLRLTTLYRMGQVS